MAREIIHAGLHDREFIARATSGFDAYAASVDVWTLERGRRRPGCPPSAIRELAHAYATANRAQLCWTLGITEHHNAVDNVLALINLALLCGHVGRYGSGLNPLRGQNNVQGGGDMGAIPNRLAGFQDLQDPEVRARFDAAWGARIPAEPGLHLSGMFEAMGAASADRALRDRGEPGPIRSGRLPRRRPPRGPRPPGRPGHVPHPHGRARRRRPAGDGCLVRERGHGHLERAPGAARPQGPRASGRGTRRHRHPARVGRPTRPRLVVRGRRGRVGRGTETLAHARRHVVRRASRRSAGSSGRAPPTRRWSRRSCTVGCGPRIRRRAGRSPRSPSSPTSCRSTSSTPTTRCG